jgi:hypothetical protein
MLNFGDYLLGVLVLGILASFATLGAVSVRSRLLPTFSDLPAHLATAVLALALLIWTAEILGSFGLFAPVPFLVLVSAVGLGLWLGVGEGREGPSRLLGFSPGESVAVRGRFRGEKQDAAAREGPPLPSLPTLIALAVAAVALVGFGLDVRPKLGTGMTGFDSTWYHGPFAAGFFQTGNTWDLHFIAPQFLAWFYPANSELFHAMGMLAFDRDVVSPLLNLGWFGGCLVAAWCIGRPFGVAPFSLALSAIALSVPALADQAGEARNDIVGTFFLLAAVAVAVNAWSENDRRLPTGALIVAGLAVGLAAGTKLNFLLPAAVFVGGLVVIAPAGQRRSALAAAGIPALAGGGYWYLRNLIHTGNPLPWIDSIGPISLPAPDQALGGRDAHSVLGYLTDGSVWSDWFLPGLHDGFGLLWPLLAGAALVGLLLSMYPFRCSLTPYKGVKEQRKLGFGVLGIAGVTGLAVAVAWLIAPTSASGPDGMPRGFESGLRYLAPALVLGLALLPTTPQLRRHLVDLSVSSPFLADNAKNHELTIWRRRGFAALGVGVGLAALVVAVGYPVQRHYLESRYADPSFTTPGLNAAFEWSRSISSARIATTSTRQYPLFGTDLSNHVDYVGIEQPHGGFTVPTSCRSWRRLLNAGDYDYVIATLDRTEAGKEAYPPSAAWTSDPNATPVLRKLPTKVFRLRGPLDPSSCGR